jgi:hypothetical protein
MRPTYEEALSGACKWHSSHRGVRYELSWHGASEYSPQGTWCWYLLLPQEQFNSEDWARLRLEKQDKKFHEDGSWHRHYTYDRFPDLEPHGEWTFGEMELYLGRDGKEYEHVKVGCDYAHLWDREGGFWQGKSDVEHDVKRSIDLLCAMFPNMREKCSYSGKWGEPEEFYTARNGTRVHNDYRAKFSETEWAGWLPAETGNEREKTNV